MTLTQLTQLIAELDTDTATVAEMKKLHQALKGTKFDTYPLKGKGRAAYEEFFYCIQSDLYAA